MEGLPSDAMIGKEPVPGDANDTLLAETAEDLVRDAMGEFD